MYVTHRRLNAVNILCLVFKRHIINRHAAYQGKQYSSSAYPFLPRITEGCKYKPRCFN